MPRQKMICAAPLGNHRAYQNLGYEPCPQHPLGSPTPTLHSGTSSTATPNGRSKVEVEVNAVPQLLDGKLFITELTSVP